MSAACWIGLSVIEATGLVLALTTEANAERAQQLAEALLERHLVACVSIHPVLCVHPPRSVVLSLGGSVAGVP